MLALWGFTSKATRHYGIHGASTNLARNQVEAGVQTEAAREMSVPTSLLAAFRICVYMSVNAQQ